MSAPDRRFSQRHDAAPLKVELCQRNWLGQWQPPHHAIALEITLDGLSILSPLKIRRGQRLLIAIGNRHHSLQQLTAAVVQQTPQGRDFIYKLHFELDSLSDSSRQSAEAVLQRLLTSPAG
ncbi:hypothetical protein [Candidatus Thalassolituus haligoni]|uniref:hypothetical protein n=1 Tax=Candidatus Thalassolituus haligoni TaxID=3100113 RepID=UPI00351565BC